MIFPSLLPFPYVVTENYKVTMCEQGCMALYYLCIHL